MSLEDFTRSYLKTALWSSTGPEDRPLDHDFEIKDFAPETLDAMKADAKAFYSYYHDLFNGAEFKIDDQAGIDFWLSRNGHGSGFHDWPWQKWAGEYLGKAAKTFGEYHLYIGDDEKIYGSGSGKIPRKMSHVPSGHPLEWYPPDDDLNEPGPQLGISFPEHVKKFSTPEVVLTPGAEDVDEALLDLNKELLGYLERHFAGDWGEVGKEDWAHNDAMLAQKGMILSAYTVETGDKIWIITDAGHKVTTILLPSEY